jgi:hypothetical protein
MSRPLRRGLQATDALGAASTSNAYAAVPGAGGPVVPGLFERDARDHGCHNEHDEGFDEEGAALAELGHLLDALSDTVGALAGNSRAPRRAQMRVLETALRATGARATALCLRPTSRVPRNSESPAHFLPVDRAQLR